MEQPDFRSCPHCGAQPLAIESEDRVYEYTSVELTLDAQGTIRTAAWGTSDVDWGGATTIRYFCSQCDTDLPEAFQDALDAALGNRREGA